MKTFLLFLLVVVLVSCKKDEGGKEIDTKKDGIEAILGSYNLTNNYTLITLDYEDYEYDTVSTSKTYIITIDRPSTDKGLGERVVEIRNLLITQPTEKVYATLSPSGDILDLLNISEDEDDYVFRSFQGVINNNNIVFNYSTYHFVETGKEEGVGTATKR